MKRTGNDIEVISKIFLDDLQTSMGLTPGEELPEDYKGADDLIQRFIDKSLIIYVNEKPLNLKLAKTEAALPAVWVTFTANKIEWRDTNVFSVDNKIMTDLFEDQKNIFKIHIDGEDDEHIFSSDQTLETFNF
tara:strand:- start:1963 stop:2361 length:399 start_codon:yes stop_codon:yes gene_type:complete